MATLPSTFAKQFVAMKATWRFKSVKRSGGEIVVCEAVDQKSRETFAKGEGLTELDAAKDALANAKTAVRPRTPTEIAASELALRNEIAARDARIRELEAGHVPPPIPDTSPPDDDDAHITTEPTDGITPAASLSKLELKAYLNNKNVAFDPKASITELRALGVEYGLAPS